MAMDLTRRQVLKLGGIAALGCALGGSATLSGCAAPVPAGTAVSSGELSYELVQEAARVLDGVVIPTPLVPSTVKTGVSNLFFKLENLQRTNSFKLRGSYFKIGSLGDEERSRGIATCSAGNHAQGVAYAARDLGIQATIFIPSIAPQEKVDRTRAYGVDVRVVEGMFEDAKAAAEAFVEESGAVYVPPYDDYAVMAGQGTIACEILAERDDVDAIVVPVGGGGLISGIACAAKAVKPSIKVYGVESEGAPSMRASLDAGEAVSVQTKESLADGIDVARPGDKTFPVVRELVDDVLVVSEGQIADAVRELASQQKLVAEGAGAVSVAAVMAGLVPVGADSNVVCVVSGGNMDDQVLADLLEG
ncbi:threonine ammonia-lyase [Arabiibacter massiliensis]|uniref:threonine ammonia-lyase n=1 Tax=Arabiibacter massiliensis TaxID=1870985 RepID=UPI00155AEEB6|nr:threonine/serine dehydratase [Arabiibacter massiliensis]